MAAKRIFLLIEHTTFREALARVLDKESDLEVVSQVGSLAVVGDVNLDHNIDVALVALTPLSEGEGMAMIRQLSTHHGDAVALVLSSVSDPSTSSGLWEQAQPGCSAPPLASRRSWRH